MTKKNNFLRGAAILSIAGVIVKILGAVYRIPLSNIIKSEGMGYYQTAYPLYTLLLTISTAGFPIAIAKLVSEKRAVGDFKAAYKVFKVTLLGLTIGGLLTSLFLFFRAESIVDRLGNKNAYYALIALVPALFFVPIMSAFRGFFQGRQLMVPTALSQIVEQLFRVGAGLTLTYLLLDKGIPMAAGGASFGGSAGAIAGAATMALIYFYGRKEIKKELKSSIDTDEYEINQIIKDLLIIAIPITIGASIVPIMDYIDLELVLTRLQIIGYTEAEANGLYGNLKGMAQTLINLPQVFSIAISMSLVPAVSDANARKNKKEMESTIASGIRITLLIGLPCTLGLFVLARPIIELLYYKNDVATIINVSNSLSILAFSVIFLTMVQALSAILQGLGRPGVPAINLFVGAVVKIFLSYTLTVIPSINIYGAAISTVVAFGIAAILDLISVVKYAKIRLNIKDIFIKPFIASLGMAIAAFISYMGLINIVAKINVANEMITRLEKLSTLGAVLVGVIVYVVLLVLTGSITEEDWSLLPKGDKIGKKLEKFKLIK
ncbi:stage V sporulation protein B [Tissierella sp. P1]|jgi:stage V sporulation protein B|uniref:putative polysaccharide biosynthesis protein n=1 Tax=Tissierella TaxID=41273 RepID=UPI000BA15F0E|nr:polysaccharide biosynthesis protein [Tissierella sp. P1]OZV11417.1 stage V sporulation protein B [Tissierella sp. P1]